MPCMYAICATQPRYLAVDVHGTRVDICALAREWQAVGAEGVE